MHFSKFSFCSQTRVSSELEQPLQLFVSCDDSGSQLSHEGHLSGSLSLRLLAYITKQLNG